MDMEKATKIKKQLTANPMINFDIQDEDELRIEDVSSESSLRATDSADESFTSENDQKNTKSAKLNFANPINPGRLRKQFASIQRK